jgi:hypothetical protein
MVSLVVSTGSVVYVEAFMYHMMKEKKKVNNKSTHLFSGMRYENACKCECHFSPKEFFMLYLYWA